jgi:hypothetical protein
MLPYLLPSGRTEEATFLHFINQQFRNIQRHKSDNRQHKKGAALHIEDSAFH